MATTIYTYLHNDDLNGSRIVSMDDCMCKLYNIIRDDSEFMKDFEKDLQSPALYILINKEESKAYIGETDDFIKRISQHIVKKKFWTEVMVFLGTNEDTLSKTEVQYLEYLAIEKAKHVNSYDLSENGQAGKMPHMNVMLKGKTDKFFRYVMFLSKFVGCDIFEYRTNQPSVVHVVAQPPLKVSEDLGISTTDLGGRVRVKLNGIVYDTKGKLGYAVVKEYLKKYPKTKINELKAIFHNGLLGRWGAWNFIEDDIELARNLKEESGQPRHLLKEEYILRSCDGVRFAVSNQWEKGNVLFLLQIAKNEGWSYEIIK